MASNDPEDDTMMTGMEQNLSPRPIPGNSQDISLAPIPEDDGATPPLSPESIKAHDLSPKSDSTVADSEAEETNALGIYNALPLPISFHGRVKRLIHEYRASSPGPFNTPWMRGLDLDCDKVLDNEWHHASPPISLEVLYNTLQERLDAQDQATKYTIDILNLPVGPCRGRDFMEGLHKLRDHRLVVRRGIYLEAYAAFVSHEVLAGAFQKPRHYLALALAEATDQKHLADHLARRIIQSAFFSTSPALAISLRIVLTVV
jgi:hypothetical protein